MNKKTKLSGSVILGDGEITPYSRKDVDRKFDQMTVIILSVVIILLVMVATLVIDSFHINSAIYKEYSDKTESVETAQKINQEMLNQMKENQQLIIDLRKQLLEKK